MVRPQPVVASTSDGTAANNKSSNSSSFSKHHRPSTVNGFASTVTTSTSVDASAAETERALLVKKILTAAAAVRRQKAAAQSGSTDSACRQSTLSNGTSAAAANVEHQTRSTLRPHPPPINAKAALLNNPNIKGQRLRFMMAVNMAKENARRSPAASQVEQLPLTTTITRVPDVSRISNGTSSFNNYETAAPQSLSGKRPFSKMSSEREHNVRNCNGSDLNHLTSISKSHSNGGVYAQKVTINNKQTPFIDDYRNSFALFTRLMAADAAASSSSAPFPPPPQKRYRQDYKRTDEVIVEEDPLYEYCLRTVALTLETLTSGNQCTCANCILNWQRNPLRMVRRLERHNERHKDKKAAAAAQAAKLTAAGGRIGGNASRGVFLFGRRPTAATPNAGSIIEQALPTSEKIMINSYACLDQNCLVQSPTRRLLFRHMYLVHSRSNFRCLLGCKHFFVREPEVVKHVAELHHTVKYFPCFQCPNLESFTSYDDLKKHYRREHEMGQYKCGCPDHHEVFHYRSEVIAHIHRIHYQNGLLDEKKMASLQARLLSTEPLNSGQEAQAEVMQNLRDFTPVEQIEAQDAAGAPDDQFPETPYSFYRSQEEFELRAASFPPPLSEEQVKAVFRGLPKIKPRGDSEERKEAASAAKGEKKHVFACRWSGCRKKCSYLWNLRTHIRTKHFRLPKTKQMMQRVCLNVDKIDELENSYVQPLFEE